MDNQNGNGYQNPTPAPAAPESGAALLAELQKITAGLEANQQAIESGFANLTEELEQHDQPVEPEESAPILTTPAATDRDVGRTSEPTDRRRASTTAADRDSERVLSNKWGHPMSKRMPKQQDGEDDDSFLDRLWNLPPVGPKARQWFEPRDQYEARRHDGTADD